VLNFQTGYWRYEGRLDKIKDYQYIFIRLSGYYKVIVLLPKMLSFLNLSNQLCYKPYLTRLKWRVVNIDILKIASLVLCSAFAFSAFGQYNWKLSKEKDGIRVYQSGVEHSNYKSIKVECTLEGSYDKLMAVLNNVSHHKDWIYHNKTSQIINRVSPYEFYYYTETVLPWPMSNRDAVVHLKMNKDSLNRFLKITAVSVPNYIPEKSGKVRVPKSAVSWYVTMPTTKTIGIVYMFEAEPGGSLPAWVANMFADKGPYETFKKLSDILKR